MHYKTPIKIIISNLMKRVSVIIGQSPAKNNYLFVKGIYTFWQNLSIPTFRIPTFRKYFTPPH